jgi:peptide chain release factor 3
VHLYNQLREDIDLLNIAGDHFEMDKVRSGELTPMFFGSAMTNFGIQPFLEEFIGMAPSPGKRSCDEGEVCPDDDNFSGFVFKIQANMNPAHRDRIAFIRICSGKFLKGIEVNHPRVGKIVRLSQPQQFFAQDRTLSKRPMREILLVYLIPEFLTSEILCAPAKRT